ncbi:MAG: TadE/TadG family type IV pilus assembly protein [Acidimicrobiales bacterium]
MFGRSRRNERGAIAILVSVVLVGAALPLAALGYASYVRGATVAELQRAADSGALAGAAAIPLADLSYATTYVNNLAGIPLLPPIPGAPLNPLTVACQQARRAALADNGFSKTYATPAPNGTTTPACTAEYTPDQGVLGGIISCVSGIVNYSPLTGLLAALLSLVQGVVNNLLGAGNIGNLLPALLQPGIKVTLNWNERGPLDALSPGDDGTAKVQTTTSTARRRFKNVVVLPNVPGSTGIPIPLNQTFNAAAQALIFPTLFQLNTTVGNALSGLGISGCGNLVGSLTSDLSDLVNPPADVEAPTVQQILDDAFATAQPVLLLRIPPNPTAVLSNPFLDFVPVCVEKTGGTFTGLVQNLPSTTGCIANAPGAFRATLVK